MKAVILTAILAISATSALAETQQHRTARHQHIKQLHKEHQVLQHWMDMSEVSCRTETGDDFHACYVRTMARHHKETAYKFSPETEASYIKIVTPRHQNK